MKAAILTILLPLLASAVLAEETNTPTPASVTNNATPTGVASNVAPRTITIDGTTYEEVRWGRLTPSAVTIFHKSGVASIPLWKLPPDLQKQFGYDSRKAADWQKVEQQTSLREQQYAKYRVDERLFLDGRLVDASQVQEMHGTIVSTPASVKADDGRTYTGTILGGTRAVGYDIKQYPGLVGQGDYNAAIPQLAPENFFVKDFFPSDKIGTSVSFQGALINPIGRYTAWATARRPSFEEWQKLQKQQ
jgi:hypothetical protein